MIDDGRWSSYVLEQGDRFHSFWRAHMQTAHRSLLFVIGRGFDPRVCLALEAVIAATTNASVDVLALDFAELNPPSGAIADLVEINWQRVIAAVGASHVRTVPINIWSENGQRIGAQEVARRFQTEPLLGDYTDIVVDISAVPRGLYFPLVATLLFRVDDLAEGVHRPNVHIIVAENPDLDASIRDEGIDDKAQFIHLFTGTLAMEVNANRPHVWIPLLGERQQTQIERIYELVTPDEICPVLPSPARDPRRADNIVLSNHQLLFDQLRVDPSNFVYAAEHNPFEVYAQIRSTALHYRDALQPVGGCLVALSALSSKLMSVGALLAGYEMKSADVGVAHIEPRAYDFDLGMLKANQDDCVLTEMWICGDCYE
jgi:hypothetical protein